MNNYEKLVRSWEAQADPNEMSSEKKNRIDLAISKSDEFIQIHKELWKAASSTEEDYDYSPEIKVENIEELTSEEWLESRKEGIVGAKSLMPNPKL